MHTTANRSPSLGVTDATGFVAVDNVNKVIVVAYRGSASLGNWIGNFNVEFNAFQPCNGCQVHAGFLSSWNDSKDQVVAALQQATASNPSYSIVYTGHSLGAAIVTLAAAELRQQGFPGALVSLMYLACLIRTDSSCSIRMAHLWSGMPILLLS